MSRKLVGYCSVDSGQILLTDPCYLHDWEDNDALSEADLNASEPVRDEGYSYTYGGACAASCNEDSAGQLRHAKGHAGAGVCVRSGFGDGQYPVYVEYSDEGHWGIRVSRVVIDFGLDDE